MNLTSRRLEAHGLYLIEDGQNMFLWLGKNAVPALVNDAFGLNSYEEVRAGKVSRSSFDDRRARTGTKSLVFVLNH
jgi:protein transport protein SEC24